jgi:hypothetical protein
MRFLGLWRKNMNTYKSPWPDSEDDEPEEEDLDDEIYRCGGSVRSDAIVIRK